MSSQKLYVKIWRAGENSPSALLIHGLGSSSLTWLKLAKDLNSLGYNVIAPDLSGHGKSPRSSNYSLQQWTEDILSLNLTPDIIVGHSLGGLVAASIQKTLNARKLVLIDPVFHLPKNNFLLRSIQHVFSQIMVSKVIRSSSFVSKIIPSKYSLRSHVISMQQWDRASVQALSSHPKVIASRLMSGKEDILLMRARGSYILPQTVMKRSFRGNVTLSSFKVGHNIHIEAYDNFWTQMNMFITKKEEIVG